MTSASPGRVHGQDSPRRQNWAGKSPQQVLDMYPPGRTPVNRVVDVLIELFNPAPMPVSRLPANGATQAHRTAPSSSRASTSPAGARRVSVRSRKP